VKKNVIKNPRAKPAPGDFPLLRKTVMHQ